MVGNFVFTDITTRKNFLCKVYSIVTGQLLITLVLVVMATFHKATKHYIKSHPNLSFMAFIITFGILIALACCEQFRRRSPNNYILLFVFTLAQTFLLAVSVARYYPKQVHSALVLTTLLCLALTIFALQTKIDFTSMRSFLMVSVIVVLVMSIVSIYFPTKMLTLIIVSFWATLFSSCLIYDTQMMVGGAHKYSISPEEYIFAALTIYVDIINIFIYILTIIGRTSSDD